MKKKPIAIYDQLSPNGRDVFSSRLVRKSLDRQKIIIDRGDPVSGAYFVLEGALRVFLYSADGKETTLYRIEPGDTCILALNALFNDLLYPAWVETCEDTVVGFLPGNAYRTLFSSEPAIQDLTIHALSNAVFGLMSSLEVRHSQSVGERLVGYLLLVASSDGTISNTQQEIAQQIGTSREVIGRHMADFASKGLLKSNRGIVTLLDIPALNRQIDV